MEQWSAPQEVIIGDEHKSQSLCILFDMFKKARFGLLDDFVFLKVSFIYAVLPLPCQDTLFSCLRSTYLAGNT